MTASQQIIQKLDQLIQVISDRDMDYVRTQGALRILRLSNPRDLKPIRERLLTSKGDYMRSGKEYEYKTNRLREIRQQADMGQIILK